MPDTLQAAIEEGCRCRGFWSPPLQNQWPRAIPFSVILSPPGSLYLLVVFT